MRRNHGRLVKRLRRRPLTPQTGVRFSYRSPFSSCNSIVGVDYGEGPPVPISNTVVKLTGADNTWLATAREDKLTPTQAASESLRLFSSLRGSGQPNRSCLSTECNEKESDPPGNRRCRIQMGELEKTRKKSEKKC